MKKNPNTQVHRQCRKKSVSPQVLSKAAGPTVFTTSRLKSQTVTLVFTGPDGSECARVAMSGRLFTCLKVAARKLGVSMAEFVEQAAWEYLKRDTALVKGGAR